MPYPGAVRIAKGAKPTLFQRAVGYEYETTITAENGEQVQHLVFVPPEVRACILWLAGWGAVKGVARRPGWRSLTAAERTTADMSAVERQATIEEFQRRYGDHSEFKRRYYGDDR
jgi:hypothetical protein